jgi:hypothetical protein|tara:strand:+ start:274 stop:765 length:492 start_codon:yes stop_codon:yes gene_type:complete
MIKTKKQVRKRQNGHLIQVELEHLKKLAIMVAEMDDLLEGLEAKSIEDFEKNINELTSFTNAMVSSAAFSLEDEYKRLLELEILIDGKLCSKDLTKSKDLKSSVIASVIDKHTEFYTENEQETKQTLETIMNSFNSLTLESRKQIAFNRSGELSYTPFSELRF